MLEWLGHVACVPADVSPKKLLSGKVEGAVLRGTYGCLEQISQGIEQSVTELPVLSGMHQYVPSWDLNLPRSMYDDDEDMSSDAAMHGL